MKLKLDFHNGDKDDHIDCSSLTVYCHNTIFFDKQNLGFT